MMKITGLSHLFKWENMHNWWLTKYFFAPLYMFPPLHQAAAALGEMYHKHPVLYNSSIVCSFQPKVIYKVNFVTSLVI